MCCDRKTEIVAANGRNEFYPLVAGLSFSEKSRPTAPPRGRRFRHLVGFPLDAFWGRFIRHVPLGGHPRAEPGHSEGTLFLGWPELLIVPPGELVEVPGQREVWVPLLRLLPLQPGQIL